MNIIRYFLGRAFKPLLILLVRYPSPYTPQCLPKIFSKYLIRDAGIIVQLIKYLSIDARLPWIGKYIFTYQPHLIRRGQPHRNTSSKDIKFWMDVFQRPIIELPIILRGLTGYNAIKIRPVHFSGYILYRTSLRILIETLEIILIITRQPLRFPLRIHHNSVAVSDGTFKSVPLTPIILRISEVV